MASSFASSSLSSSSFSPVVLARRTSGNQYHYHHQNEHQNNPKSPPPLKKSIYARRRIASENTTRRQYIEGDLDEENDDKAEVSDQQDEKQLVLGAEPLQALHNDGTTTSPPRCTIGSDNSNGNNNLQSHHIHHNHHPLPPLSNRQQQSNHSGRPYAGSKERAALEVTDDSSELVASIVRENDSQASAAADENARRYAEYLHSHFHYYPYNYNHHHHSPQIAYVLHGKHTVREQLKWRQAELRAWAQQAEQQEEHYLQFHVDLSKQYEHCGDLTSSLHILEGALQATTTLNEEHKRRSSLSVHGGDGGGSFTGHYRHRITWVIANPLRRAHLLYRSGWILYKSGQYLVSMSRLNQARDIICQQTPHKHQLNRHCHHHPHLQSLGVDQVVSAAVGVGRGCWSETMTDIHLALGKVAFSMGNTSQAKRYSIRALRILELDALVLEDDDSPYSRYVQLLQAKVLRHLGDIFLATLDDSHVNAVKRRRASEKARTALAEALRLQQAVWGYEGCSRSTDYALTLVTLGQYYETMGDYANAAGVYLDALDIYRCCCCSSSEPLSSSSSSSQAGAPTSSSGNALYCSIPCSSSSASSVISPFSVSSSSCRVDMGVTLARIGWLYSLNKEYEEALRVYQEAYDLIFPTLGNHPNIASLHLKIGMVYAAKQHWYHALKRYRKALEIQRQCHGGENHESIAQTLSLIAACYSSEHQQIIPQEQQQPSQREDERQAQQHHNRHSNSIIFASPATKRAMEKALQIWDSVLQIRMNLCGRGHLSVAKTLVPIGRLYHRTGQVRKAVDCISWALETFHSHGLDAFHPLVIEARSVL